MTESDAIDNPEKTPRFEENVDFYYDAGLMVLTARFLLRRGYCCGNGCRHCPYDAATKELQRR